MSRVGAGNRVRTGDLNLGKVALYQLSYSRALGLTQGSYCNRLDPGVNSIRNL